MGTVNVSESSQKEIVKLVVEGVTKQREADLLEQYKSFARQEAELAKARDEIVRKDQEIAGLRSHINTLNGFVATMAPGNGVPIFNPYNNNGPAVTTHAMPTFPERYAASAQVPSLPVPDPAAG